MAERKNIVEEAAERVRRERGDDERVKPLRPEQDLSWERLDRDFDLYNYEADYE